MNKDVAILVVNDDPAILHGVSRLLRTRDYHVYEATTGTAGWQLAQTHRPDLIVLDLILPGIQGDELCRRLKADPTMAGTLIILFSAVRISSDHRAMGLDIGADGYLTWPMPNREFIAYMEAMVRLQRSEASLREVNATLQERIQERTATLERTNRELEQFIYLASHDLKAPLRAINSLANWIGQDAAEQLPVTSQQHLIKLQSRVDRMEKLLDDLLLYSSIEQQYYAQEFVEITGLIQSVCNKLKVPSDFSITIEQPMPMLFTTREPLRMVLQNLISNAIKHHHAPRTGQIRIGVQEQMNAALFHVTDNGPGIDLAYHARIFQVCQTLKPRDEVEGSGLGLAIAKRLVERHGGSIEVESTGGQGATFRFIWPIAPDA